MSIVRAVQSVGLPVRTIAPDCLRVALESVVKSKIAIDAHVVALLAYSAVIVTLFVFT